MIKREKKFSKLETTFNANAGTLYSKITEELEKDKFVCVNTYINTEGRKEKEITFKLEEQLINKIKKNGKS